MMIALPDTRTSTIRQALLAEFRQGGWERLREIYFEMLEQISVRMAVRPSPPAEYDRTGLPRLLVAIERDSQHYTSNQVMFRIWEVLQSAADSLPDGPVLALFFGVVQDRSYTTLDGTVRSYSGTGVVEMADGRRYVATGHGPTGTADYVRTDGYVSYVPIN
jgi:hypothetical protein